MTTWFVTGGAGSVGSAVVRHLLAAPSTVRVYDADENGLWQLEQSLSPEERKRVRIILGDVTDRAHVERAIEGAEYCIHAAAAKHVPMGESNPDRMLAVNCLGTQYVRDAAHKAGLTCAVLVSTDKAEAPCNTMGATKMLAERVWLAGNQWGKVRYQVGRFGNILGSRGSVIPLWRKQAAAGEPLTLTDSRMTRYVITDEAAARFLVHLARVEVRPGVQSPPMCAIDLASLAAAVAPGAPVVWTGMRPGEKLDEAIAPGQTSATAPRLTVEEIRALLDGR